MKKYFLALIVLGLSTPLFSQTEIKIMGYNVENLFDIYPDSITNDKEYAPGGYRGWNYERYNTKLTNIAKVVAAAGEWDLPTLIGLCEIENRRVLDDLTQKTGLRNLNYQIVQYESLDARGIDVALLYRPDNFKLINSRPIRIQLPNTTSTTRDILYASGSLSNGDTLHVFMNHFPSRMGGELESEERRNAVAGYLRAAVDSLHRVANNPKIVILGDFNDMPDNSSMIEVLGAKPLPKKDSEVLDKGLYNLTYKFHEAGTSGSYFFQGKWDMLDQIIVSGSLLNGKSKSRVDEPSVRIFSADWLLEDDKYSGKRPSRTYIGMKYNGGYSDHLPVLVNIILE